ncbi:MAG: putative DNA binding domain-containing protein [Gammaproteobacteria bacterium]|nr:putative DNA binding domain-containing protein [Gammaproteobacteria bacterium]
MSDSRTIALIEDLRALPAETAWAEFKQGNTDPQRIGRLISALANAARIADQETGYLVWGIRNSDHAVIGTAFEPASTKRQGQPLEHWLTQHLQPDLAFSFDIVQHPEGRLVLLSVPSATIAPVEYDRTAFVRIGEATPRLADHPDRQRALWDKLRPYVWEAGIAQGFLEGKRVLELVDCDAYYDDLGKPMPTNEGSILEDLAQERLVSADVGGRWNILNLGAILFAKDMRTINERLARKAVRFVMYDGTGRDAQVLQRRDFPLGYAAGFVEMNNYINAIVPSPEQGGIVRSAEPLFPAVAIREVLANSLIHQDMTITGAGPTVELFRNRLEITNPGKPLVEPDRFIDSPPRSRNEALASLMRRLGLCEEQGTGIDKVVAAVGKAQLPPPEFRAEAAATRVSLFAARPFARTTTQERLRACYQHAVLLHLSGDQMRNRELRERFGIKSSNSAQVSDVIRQALNEGLIRIADPARPRSGYVPFWA